jgi:hypothetical protein
MIAGNCGMDGNDADCQTFLDDDDAAVQKDSDQTG